MAEKQLEENVEENSGSPSGETSETNPHKKSRLSSKRLWMLGGFTVLILVAVGIYAIYYVLVGQFYVSTDDAYVNGNEVHVMARVEGTAVDIPVMATKLVHKGDVLVKLDDTDAALALDQAKANLAQTVRDVQALIATGKQQKAQIQANKAQLELIEKNYKRYKYMLGKGAITQEQFDKKATQVQVAKAQLGVANGKLTVIRAKIGMTKIADNPQVKLAGSKVRQDYLNLQRTKILAPVSGYISQRVVRVGQKVKTGESIMTIVPLHSVWVDANFKETNIANMRIGQPVILTADMYGSDVIFHGKIAGLYGGTGSSFALLPPQNATGNWIKIVQRVPVRITLNADELESHPLYLGLSMSATVDVSDTNGLRMAGVTKPGAGHSTDVYKSISNKAEALVKKIIANNIQSRSIKN